MKAYALRLPEELHAELVERAAASKRSLNSEIIYRLEASTDNGVTLSGEIGLGSQQPAVRGARPGRGGAGGTDGKAAPPPSRPKTKGARTVMCEHRRPAGAFCPKCDV